MTKFFAAVAALIALGAAGSATADTHRIDAESTETITFEACRAFQLSAVGDGDTDLDLDLRMIDPFGRTVFVDDDLTDMTFQTVQVGRCGTYTLYVANLGSVWNGLDLDLEYID